MKKTFYLSIMMGLCLTFFAFTPAETSATNYQDVTDNIDYSSIPEVGSFEEAEESAVAEDKSTWVKRHKIWTISLNSSNGLNKLKSILDKN